MIVCDFGDDYCHWEVESSDEASGFIFERVTSQYLQNNGISGPEISHLGYADDPFVYVTANGTVDEKGFNTLLKSPLLNGRDHSEECFHFWFDFNVRIQYFFPIGFSLISEHDHRLCILLVHNKLSRN